MSETPQTWELWYPEAGATGLPFARCQVDPTNVMWVHAAPPTLAVTVRKGADVVARQAKGDNLARKGDRTPMTRLSIEDGVVRREDRWPGPDDIGAVVLLPGGEAGILRDWWNREDQREWRWSVEFYNSLD